MSVGADWLEQALQPQGTLADAAASARLAGAEADLARTLAERAEAALAGRLDRSALVAFGIGLANLGAGIGLEALRSPEIREAAARWAINALARALGVSTERAS